MEDKLGECFEGVISGITSWGIYVELPNTVEGLVHVSKIPGDRYYFDELHYEMVGERTNRRYVLGQRVKVVLVNTDKASRTIDFAIPDAKGEIRWKDYL